jgi:propionate CoA-transferase
MLKRSCEVAAQVDGRWQLAAMRFNLTPDTDSSGSRNSVSEKRVDEHMIIVRRAAMELEPSSVASLGIPVLEDIATAASGEELGSLCQAFVGIDKADPQGNVNVSGVRRRELGRRGLINIAQNASKVVYYGSFTAGGLRIAIEEGRLIVKQEGKAKTFVNDVEQVTFSSAYATSTKHAVLFVTERAVFEMRNGAVTLTEVAPGVNFERDIIGQMEFFPQISPTLKLMPSAIFKGELNVLEANVAKVVAARVHLGTVYKSTAI